MDDRLVVGALRGQDPDAFTVLYDDYAERVFQYCWFHLRDQDAAQVAVRDTFIVAQAHIGKLRDPSLFRPWLYAIARAESLRHRAPVGEPGDIPVASPDQDDVDLRVLAWNTADTLTAPEREAIELTTRHALEPIGVAAVLGIPAREAQALLRRARENLERALTAEILARKGDDGCAERAGLLADWDGRMDRALRERLARHAAECEPCRRHRPRNVSATKVFSLLPVASRPTGLRVRVIGCLTDRQLKGYRGHVAARAHFGPDGFPAQRAAERGVTPVWAGLLAAVSAVAAVALVFHQFGGGIAETATSIAAGTWSGAQRTDWFDGGGQEAAGSAVPGSAGASERGADGRLSADPSASTSARGPGEPSAPPRGDGAGPPTRDHQSDPAPTSASATGPGPTAPAPGQLRLSTATLSLGTSQSSGRLILTAVGGPVEWTVGGAGPAVTVAPAGGSLAEDQQVTLTVDVDRNVQPEGEATLSFGPGEHTVRLTWSSEPSPDPTHSSSAG
ncbi:hypothetical protein [Allonocardiopsis opalescens]|uniref:DNA-directed RNA polymerase specialized sigma24 family protein n=1 Tax=Allonocardiopsis opalescens TaxID=1144618 RepID=A0A2T0Q2C9_9ACTN|nr:hypothetical protein [Allonocardiopsis opalescens]PRX97860.1 DNA-directed RNA polymerase specialized sigma24 family protein [Allonocardiopsis opalescens]